MARGSKEKNLKSIIEVKSNDTHNLQKQTLESVDI